MKRLLPFLLAVTLLPAAYAAAADAPGPSVRVAGNKVGVVSLVLSGDPGGGTIDPSSVSVTSGGVRLSSNGQTIAASQSAAPAAQRAVYLVLDTSGSMAGAGITAARTAAISFIQALPADVSIGIITFSDSVSVRLPATTNHASAVRALSAVNATGGTALYDAIVRAATLLGAFPSGSMKRVLILSDGADNASSTSEAKALALLKATATTADVVAFRIPSNKSVLNQLAAASHGSLLEATSADRLAGVFAQAGLVFRPQVEVTVQVPPSLQGRQVALTVSAQQGTRTINASTSVVPMGARTQTKRAVASSDGSPNWGSLQIWVVVLLAFLGCLALALIMLFTPLEASERARRTARLNQVGRYRLAGATTVSSTGSRTPLAGTEHAESAVGRRALEAADRALRARGVRRRVNTDLEAAGLRLRPEEWAVFHTSVVIATAAGMALLLRNPLGVPIGGVVAVIGARAFLNWRRSRREALFLDQLPDALQLVEGALRAGFSLPQSIAVVVREGPEPTSSEFQRALTEVRLGSDLEDALDDVAARMACEELAWVVVAIRIAREVGGNLAEVMATTARTMRERAEIRGMVRVLSAEGRISARVLTALPFVVGAFVSVTKPGYLYPLFHSTPGLVMLIGGGLLLAVGVFWLSRLIRIEV